MARRGSSSVLGKRIKELRQEARLSQRQIAEKVGTHANTVSRWETGFYEPNLSQMEALAKLFGVTVGSLFPQVPSKNDRPLARATGWCVVGPKHGLHLDYAAKRKDDALFFSSPKCFASDVFPLRESQLKPGYRLVRVSITELTAPHKPAKAPKAKRSGEGAK